MYMYLRLRIRTRMFMYCYEHGGESLREAILSHQRVRRRNAGWRADDSELPVPQSVYPRLAINQIIIINNK